jgi:hypothetical protein
MKQFDFLQEKFLIIQSNKKNSVRVLSNSQFLLWVATMITHPGKQDPSYATECTCD